MGSHIVINECLKSPHKYKDKQVHCIHVVLSDGIVCNKWNAIAIGSRRCCWCGLLFNDEHGPYAGML